MNRLFLVITAFCILILPLMSCIPTPIPIPTPTPVPSPMPEPTPAPTAPSPLPKKIELGQLKKVERNITIEAEGETLHYFEVKEWAEDEFSSLMKEEDRFSSNQIEEFKATYQVNAGNFDVKADEEEKSTILKCDVYTQPRTSYYDFHWFLKPLGLDFIDDYFERSERELSWEGSLDGVKTTILLKFPFKISNCHAHVWPAE